MLLKSHIFSNVLLIVILIDSIVLHNATHITGTFRTTEFFKFLAKFGFQKTERHSQRDSFGYIYGNITSKEQFPVKITFAVLDKHNFEPLYASRSLVNRDAACQKMFSTIDQFAFDKVCRPQKDTLDFLRHIPCPRDQLCEDEDTPLNVIPGHQFTYVISDLNQPRFWYISLVACYRDNITCTWHHFDPHKFRTASKSNATNEKNHRYMNADYDYEISYDIRLVNGNPNRSSSNPLTFQFSFDQQNILEMNLIFLTVYLILVPIQIYAVRIQRHPVTKLFTLSLILEFVSLVFMLGYYIRYTIGGIGSDTVKTIGDILDILSRSTFMLILLLLAKGWAVTRQQVTKSGWTLLMSVWVPYCVFHIVLYVWNRTEVDIISDIDEYQTWPGRLLLVSRSSIMLWFLWELRNTMKYEHSTRKLDFLLHFGASSLVWFIYLPIVAIVASQVSPLWRYKLLLGITNSADCLGYCVMTGLLWPNRAGQYLLLASTKYSGMDELDEFNEAPHSLRSEASSFHEIPHDDMERIDLDDDDDDDDDDQNQIINILDRTIPGQIRATDLLSDDTTTIIQGDNLMFDDTTHSIFNSNGTINKPPNSGHAVTMAAIATVLDTSTSSNNSNNFSKSDKVTNSANGAIGDVLILTNKSKQTYGNNSHNA